MAQSKDENYKMNTASPTEAAEAAKERERALELRRRADQIARQIIDMTRNGLFVTLRFMDVALCQFDYLNAERLSDDALRVNTIATTGQHMIYNPQYIIEQYMKDKQVLSRDYLHIVLHCVFRHPFVSRNLKEDYWNLACDIAVESIICDLEVKQTATRDAAEISAEIQRIHGILKQQITAERVYALLLSDALQQKDIERWRSLFYHDDHRVWWEIAKQIEEEMKRREEAEETAEEDEAISDDENRNEEAAEDEDTDGEDMPEEDTDGNEQSEEDEGNSDEAASGEEEPDEDAADGENTEDSEESSEEGDASGENEESGEEEEEEIREDTYEEEYSSVPGEDNDGENEDDMADPDSDTQDSGEEGSDDGSGGGGAGEDAEQSEEEGADRGQQSADGMNGESGGEREPEESKGKPDSQMSGTADEGQPEDSPDNDPFSDRQQGSNADMSGAGSTGSQQQESSGSEQHSAGTGGGGDGSQSAWEHSSGESTQRGDGGDSDRRGKMESAGDTEQVGASDDKKQEAKAEQGTAEDSEEEKAPSYMHNGDEQKELEEKWKEISERMLVDLETASKEWGDKSDGMVQGIKKVNRDKYDYATFLKKFSTLREDIQINDDEFDYVYYTLGMERYGNIPLIEPLEYKEVRKVRDFVIAIDTSGSCAGEVVQKFLDKTFSIFMQQENFFRKINLHILQCDAQIQEAVKITTKTEFEDYIRNLEFKGFGGTDFRPVFAYVEQMLENHEFDDLKGLIYFTDGNGTYPKRRPPYETAFIFVDDDEFEYQVPSWAMKLVLETSDITEEVLI